MQAICLTIGGSTLALLIAPDDVHELGLDIADTLIAPALRMVDPETAHNFSLKIASSIFMPKVGVFQVTYALHLTYHSGYGRRR
jgi:hypothetical protein